MTAEAQLRQIAAELYATPNVTAAGRVDAVASILRTPDLPDRVYRMAGEVLRFLTTGPAGGHAAALIVALAREKDRPAAVHQASVESLRYMMEWAPDRLDPDVLLPLLDLEHLGAHRKFLAQEVVEPSLYRAGDGLTAAAFDRFRNACGQEAFFKYFCYYVTARQDICPAIREKARAHAASAFGLHRQARDLLGRGRKRVLVIQNAIEAQGDEIIRVTVLIQALLDFNAELEIALVTPRTYLYAHPRLEVVPIGERARVEELLGRSHDVVIDFFEPKAHDLNYEPELEPMVQSCVGKWRPGLVLRTGRYDSFVFEHCELDSRPLAAELALDRLRVRNNYETTFRLIAELGLPLRCGEGRPVYEPVLAEVSGAAAAWTSLTAGNIERRRTALLNPFGGREAVKGYVARKSGLLALEIQHLIGEGFFVVILPNGGPWGRPSLIAQALSRLQPEARKHAVIGPDPEAQSGAHADDTMRLFLGFMRLADLIIAVEGWVIHAAYFLGRPYRILMLPNSQPAEWRPWAPTRNQQVDAAIPDIDEDENAPPLPAQPRKFVLLFLLLHASGGDAQACRFLRLALRSEDRDVRVAAAQSLRSFAEVGRQEILDVLDDPFYRVRGAAAATLLEHRPASGIAGWPPPEHLAAYVFIAEDPPNWRSVLKLGDAARAALEAALDDDDALIRRRSAAVLTILNLKARSRPRRRPIGRWLSGLFAQAGNGIDGTPKKPGAQTVLILTPMKDASGSIGRYSRRISHLTYPHNLISLGFLESDSQDGSYADLERCLPALRERFRRAGLWKKDFGYRVPAGVHRGAEEIQVERRTILARSRNHLLLRALDDEDWVLWLDVDVIDYPDDIIERLLATGKDIVQPHCVLEYGGPTFDRNGWRDRGSLHLDDLRGVGELVELDAVGGTMLLVRADLHRDGLIFPAFPYGVANPRVRSEVGHLETEGLGLMARDMGHPCWGMPNLEIRHRRW